MNKPVAWMSTQDLNCVSNEYLQRYPFGGKEYFTIPLYTHPVKKLTLTDEEIMKEWTWKYSDSHEDFLLKFAKAILRKAQEK